MRSWGLAVALAIVLAPAVVAADGLDSEQYSHRGQIGVHAQGGVGFRFIAPYDDEFCGDVSDENPSQGADVCSGRSPITLELGAAYGITQKLELLLEIRLGLESDFGTSPASPDDGPRQFAIQPGLKVYHRDAGITKFFSTVQLVVDTTDYGPDSDTDYGVRNVNGLQLDFHRTFGAYFFFGETLAFSRWFRFEFDAGVGLQARFP